jgi:ESCRT-I complex subunit TSG101
MGSLVHNNGMTATLISLQGTVPIYYQGSQYNIPIDIYLYEAYPRICPKIFVRPTSNMMVKPNHRSVDANGVVYLPYLNQWNFGANLVDLVNQVSSVFSSDPPLFSRPAGRAQVNIEQKIGHAIDVCLTHLHPH